MSLHVMKPSLFLRKKKGSVSKKKGRRTCRLAHQELLYSNCRRAPKICSVLCSDARFIPVNYNHDRWNKTPRAAEAVQYPTCSRYHSDKSNRPRVQHFGVNHSSVVSYRLCRDSLTITARRAKAPPAAAKSESPGGKNSPTEFGPGRDSADTRFQARLK